MPSPLSLFPHRAAAAPAEVRQALAQLLASAEFCKAQRMRRLLAFLVEKELAGEVAETAEYAIGIEVFDRDARHYSTGEDPTVRVHVGRLRERLKAYYAASGARAALRFAIPVGSYLPVISVHGAHPGAAADAHDGAGARALAIAPLANFIAHDGGAAFCQGLHEELSCRLFKLLGPRLVPHSVAAASACAVLEGSVRVDGDLIRLSLRLLDAGAVRIVWSDQFDWRGTLAITAQETLALAARGALAPHLAHA